MRFIALLLDIIKYKETKKYEFILPKQSSSSTENSSKLQPLEDTSSKIYPSIDVNYEYIKQKYNFSINSDIKIRRFYINVKNKQYNSFLLYIDGMIDSKSISQFVVEPLMLRNRSNTNTSNPEVISTAVSNNISVKRIKKFKLEDYIKECLVPQNDVSTSNTFKEVFAQVNLGVTALFIDTLDTVFMIDAKGFEKRSITPPENEIVIRGSQESFIESIRTNTSLLRRLVNNENLVIEDLSVRNNNLNQSTEFVI